MGGRARPWVLGGTLDGVRLREERREVGVARERTLDKGTPFPGLHSYSLRRVVVSGEALFYSKLVETSELWESFLTHPLLTTLDSQNELEAPSRNSPS